MLICSLFLDATTTTRDPSVPVLQQQTHPYYTRSNTTSVFDENREYQMQALIQTYVERERQYRQRCTELSTGIVPASTWTLTTNSRSSISSSSVYRAKLIYHRGQEKKSFNQ